MVLDKTAAEDASCAPATKNASSIVRKHIIKVIVEPDATTDGFCDGD
jgi:hypothetical protein